jgi:peptidoglycan/LPS O-acetylase OafA/YrhL
VAEARLENRPEMSTQAGPAAAEAALPRRGGASSRPDYNVAVGYLRGFARLLVFALHSIVAYYRGPYPPAGAVLNQSIPVRDHAQFAGARVLVAFNEISLMSLLFFLSGLFLWPSLKRKGAGGFLRERVARVLIPFIVCGGLVAAIAYYPAYLQSAAHPSVGDYARTWLSPGRWTTGPGWFLLILFIYDLVAIGLYYVAPSWGPGIARVAADSAARPGRFFFRLLIVSAAAYAPFVFLFGSLDWWHVSFFWLQKSRAMVYACYFAFGVAVGAFGLNRGLLATSGMLAKQWKWWALAAVGVFLAAGNVLRHTLDHNLEKQLYWGAASAVGWVVCCSICCFALLAVFVRFAKRSRLIDNFVNNSYGMFIVHYMFVTWSQFALLSAPLPGPAKWLSVLAITIAASWTLAAVLRRIPVIGRNI